MLFFRQQGERLEKLYTAEYFASVNAAMSPCKPRFPWSENQTGAETMKPVVFQHQSCPDTSECSTFCSVSFFYIQRTRHNLEIQYSIDSPSFM